MKGKGEERENDRKRYGDDSSGSNRKQIRQHYEDEALWEGRETGDEIGTGRALGALASAAARQPTRWLGFFKKRC